MGDFIIKLLEVWLLIQGSTSLSINVIGNDIADPMQASDHAPELTISWSDNAVKPTESSYDGPELYISCDAKNSDSHHQSDEKKTMYIAEIAVFRCEVQPYTHMEQPPLLKFYWSCDDLEVAKPDDAPPDEIPKHENYEPESQDLKTGYTCLAYYPASESMEKNFGWTKTSTEIPCSFTKFVSQRSGAAYYSSKPKMSKIKFLLQMVSTDILINLTSLSLTASLCYATFFHHRTKLDQQFACNHLSRGSKKRNRNVLPNTPYQAICRHEVSTVEQATVPQLFKALLLLSMYMALSVARPHFCGQCLHCSSKKTEQLSKQGCKQDSEVISSAEAVESQPRMDPLPGIVYEYINQKQYSTDHYCDTEVLQSKIVAALLTLLNNHL